MVKRRAAPNPEAMMIAVRFAGGRRVDGDDGDGDEEVFMVLLFLFLLVFFFFFFFFLIFVFLFLLVLFFIFNSCFIFRISSGELFVVVVVAFLFCDGDFFFPFFSKIGEEFLLFAWLVGSGAFFFFGDFGGFFGFVL